MFAVPTDGGPNTNGKDRDSVENNAPFYWFSKWYSCTICFLDQTETHNASLHIIHKSHLIHMNPSFHIFPSKIPFFCR